MYRMVVGAYRERAPNGGRLAPLPECARAAAGGRGEPCRDDLGFTYNALRVLLARYMTRDEHGVPMETPSMVMRRVALGFRGRVDPGRLYRLLVERRFMFNSPTLFNMYADGARGTLSACYVTPVYDDMKAIMDAATVQALTFKYGGGQGFSFSELRPRWDIVRGTSGSASGPLSFMRIYDVVTEMVKQGGKRRGANMGIMHAWHPDIYNPWFNPWHALRNMLPPQLQALIDRTKALIEYLEREGYQLDPAYKEMVERLAEQGWSTVEDAGFIQAKEPPLQDANLTNFNISVAANDAFMKAVVEDGEWWMVNPRHSMDPETGVYRLHYSVSLATGPGRLGRLLQRHPWLRGNPYLNIYEETLEEARRRAQAELEEQAKATGYKPSPEEKNPHAWKTSARKLWEKIVENAWAGGDPGVIYVDNHNKWNPTPWLGMVNATNPCVSGDTRVLTPEGWKTAREIWEEAKKRGGPVKAVLVDEEALGEGGEPVAYETSLVIPVGEATVYRTAHGRELRLTAGLPGEAWVWHVGRKPALRVVTEEGYEVTVTHEHKFLTPQGWKEARELRPGDKIAVARLHPAYTAKALSAAARLDPDVAFALGWLIGDGTLNEHYVAWYFGPGDEAALERVKQAVAKLGGNPEAHLRLRGKEWTLQFNAGTTVYKRMVELLGGLLPRQPERRLPEIAWRLEPESLAAFLRGLFTADGTVDVDAAVRLTSSSLQLLKDVQVLLTTLGIYSRIYERPYRKTFRYTTVEGEERVYETKGYYELVISGYSRRIFAELVGFESAEKTAKLRLAKTKRDPVWATVAKVEDAGVVDFYDFSVPGYHRYIAAGLVHHNCGEQPLYPFESCNLGSMSVEKYIDGGRFDVERFAEDVALAVDAMDAVIDFNRHPDGRQDAANRFTRKIGLGIMGLADALARLGYPYDSDEAVAFTLVLMAALEVFSWRRSWELGARLGHAPAFECRRWDWRGMRCLERGEPGELVELHTPALVKAGEVVGERDGWLVVRYHEVELTREVLGRLVGEARGRVEPDGAVRLVPLEVLERVAREVFGVIREMAWEALRMHPLKAAASPRHLLALAVYMPRAAWELLKTYGRMLGARAPRNTVTTTVAPTGTISIIAGTSSGIEPYFALVYRRRVTVGEFLEVAREFRDRLLEAAGRHRVPDEVVREVYEAVSRHKGSLRWALEEVREKLIEAGITNGFLAEVERLARLFPTSMDFDVWYHLAHQIAAQLYVDQAISKTINLPRDAPRDAVYTAYLVAWLGGLKGVTVYRDESKGVQVIYFGAEQREMQPLPIIGRKTG
ncbi:MAG: hypothetical protein GXO15_03385, partial [Crenarchaeota archaeon]|nr:hypothetical protein [Thermoproteota archaeon]